MSTHIAISYHIVFSTKDREPVLQPLLERIKRATPSGSYTFWGNLFP
jgi:hypothetical protein